MKPFFSILVLIALAFAMPASAQLAYKGPNALMSGTTNYVVATSTNTAYNYRVDCPRSEYVLLSVGFKLAGAGTGNVRFELQNGDGTGYGSNSVHAFVVPANGTARVGYVTNILVGAVPYLRLHTVGNANAENITNLVFSYGTKQ